MLFMLNYHVMTLLLEKLHFIPCYIPYVVINHQKRGDCEKHDDNQIIMILVINDNFYCCTNELCEIVEITR